MSEQKPAYSADESSAMSALFGRSVFIVYETDTKRVEAVTFSLEKAERIAHALNEYERKVR